MPNASYPRFFYDMADISNNEITISGSDAKHIDTVLRKRTGELIIVCDGKGTDYLCELCDSDLDGVRVRVLYSQPSIGESDIKVTLYQSLPKSDKFDYIVQKCVEAGISRITPVLSAHTEFRERFAGERGVRLAVRWRRLAYEAAKQSGRGIVPEIGDFQNLIDAMKDCGRLAGQSPETRLALIPYEYERNRSLKSALKAFKAGWSMPEIINSREVSRIEGRTVSLSESCVEIFYFIGPEGGFSPDEITAAIGCGIQPVSLGPRILRTETAGFLALCQIMYELE